jgi:hypothetical protein
MLLYLLSWVAAFMLLLAVTFSLGERCTLEFLTASQPINQSTNQPINQSTNQPINQSTNQPINQSTNQPINQSTD